MGVRASGMAHNIAAARLQKASASHGIPLRPIQPSKGEFRRKVPRNKEFNEPAGPPKSKAMATLLEVEDAYPSVKISLHDPFFTSVLRNDEPALCEYREDTLDDRRKHWKKEFYPQPQMEMPPEEKSLEVTRGSVND
jgi:hypothetical protein